MVLNNKILEDNTYLPMWSNEINISSWFEDMMLIANVPKLPIIKNSSCWTILFQPNDMTRAVQPLGVNVMNRVHFVEMIIQLFVCSDKEDIANTYIPKILCRFFFYRILRWRLSKITISSHSRIPSLFSQKSHCCVCM